MIKLVLETEEGPWLMLAIVEENVRKMRDGQPMHLELAELLPDGTAPARLIVELGQTHVEVLTKWNDALKRKGIEFSAKDMLAAKLLDAQLRAEGKM